MPRFTLTPALAWRPSWSLASAFWQKLTVSRGEASGFSQISTIFSRLPAPAQAPSARSAPPIASFRMAMPRAPDFCPAAALTRMAGRLKPRSCSFWRGRVWASAVMHPQRKISGARRTLERRQSAAWSIGLQLDGGLLPVRRQRRKMASALASIRDVAEIRCTDRACRQLDRAAPDKPAAVWGRVDRALGLAIQPDTLVLAVAERRNRGKKRLRIGMCRIGV